jgi:hypothetical protein
VLANVASVPGRADEHLVEAKVPRIKTFIHSAT